MAEETPTGEETVDESLMSAGDMIAQEIEKTSDAVQAEEAGDEGKETKEEGKEAGAEGKTPAPEGETKEEQAGTPARAFTAFTGDKESEDYEALDGLRVKFRADSRDQDLTVTELVREVQKGAGIAKALGTRTRERDETHQKLLAGQEELAKAQGNGDLLLKILKDEDAYKELKAKYLEAGGSTDIITPTKGAKGADPELEAGGRAEGEGESEGAEDEYMKAGRGVVEEFIIPFSQKLADAYGADDKEIAQEIIGLAGKMPGEFFTEEAMADIVNVKIPAMLVEAGFELVEGATNPDAGTTEDWFSSNGDQGYGIRKKGSSPRGQTEVETKLENRIKELEAKIEGKSGSGTPDPEKDLESVSGGPGDGGANTVESSDKELNLDGADSVSEIMKRVHAFGE